VAKLSYVFLQKCLDRWFLPRWG